MTTSNPVTPETSARPRRDDGAILVFVLVVVIMISLIAIPMLGYITTVMRFNLVQADRSQAIEDANGGVWVALSNERDLYDRCPDRSSDPATDLATSLDDVEAKCYLLDDAPLRPATEVPFHVATVAADQLVPSVIADDSDVIAYVNPSTAADPSAWLSDRTSMPTAGQVWIPQLPVQASSLGDDRMTEMPANSFDPAYATCRVFFPGTYNTQIVISEPAYFTSGVYSFTEPIVLRDGADVVVGNGTESGCTNDFEAIGNADDVPDQLNMSGLGGTFVLGGDARITVDDAGGDDIRFVINQRYVSSEETSVAASSDVAIVSVNGTHAPFFDGEALGQPLFVPGVTDVPASTVDTDGDPAAAASGYLPSTLTVKPSVPDAPQNVVADDFRIGSDGRVTVGWSPSVTNGAPVLFYVATDAVTGQTCRTLRPERSGAEVQPTCTLRNIPDGTAAQITVTATNQHGSSGPSSTVTAPAVILSGGSRSPEVPTPTPAPSGATVSPYTDGALVEWIAPTPVAGAPIGFSEVTAVDTVSGDVVTCRAGWNENRCALLASDGLTAGSTYDVTVRSLLVDGDFDRVYLARAPRVTVDSGYTHAAAGGPVPQPSATTSSGLRVPPSILDFSTSTGTRLDLRIDGYIAVPQGRMELDAAVPDRVSVSMTGGLLAGSIQLDPAAVPTELFDVSFDNPTAQKRVRIVSDVVDEGMRADAVVQINRSGSLAINSWVVGPANDTTTPAPDTGDGSGGDDGSGDDADDVPYVDAYPGGGTAGVDYDGGFSGDPSGSSDPHTCTDTSRWAVSYWNNTDLAGPAELERCEDDIDADWGTGAGPTGANDSFSARWTKTIDFPNSNIYNFTFRADDGIRMWIDGGLVHDDWTGGDTSTRIPVDVTAGEHVVEIEYYEQDSAARVSMTYEEQLSCSGATPWIGTFYGNTTLDGVAGVERCDAVIDFDWNTGVGPTGDADSFSARWVRTLDVPATRDYQLLIGSDDGIRVYVDDVSVYDRWIGKSYTEEALVLSLAAGDREIRVEYYEETGDARVRVEIEPVAAPTCGDSGQWQGQYWSNIGLTGEADLERCDATIEFNWGSGAGPSGVIDNFSARWTKTIDVSTTGSYDVTIGADDGIRMFVDGVDVYPGFWRNKGFSTQTVSIPFEAGEREVIVEYYESGGGARVLVDLSAVPTGPPPPPAAVLFQTADDAVKSGGFASDGTGWGVPNPTGSNMSGATATGSSITFTFEVAEAGDYRMSGSVLTPTGADDSFWVTGTGSPANGWQWRIGEYTTYTARNVSDFGVTDPQLVSLGVGSHQITLHLREDGTYIESLELVRQ